MELWLLALVVTVICVGLAKWLLGGEKVTHEKTDEGQSKREEKIE